MLGRAAKGKYVPRSIGRIQSAQRKSPFVVFLNFHHRGTEGKPRKKKRKGDYPCERPQPPPNPRFASIAEGG